VPFVPLLADQFRVAATRDERLWIHLAQPPMVSIWCPYFAGTTSNLLIQKALSSS
jgi:hypothetical protein